MEKIIKVGGKAVGFKTTASTIVKYRRKFNRDLFDDIQAILPKAVENKLNVSDLECFENIAYIMARQYDSTIPDDPDDWLDQFEMFDIYHILPEIADLWVKNTFEISQSKKKVEEQSEN